MFKHKKILPLLVGVLALVGCTVDSSGLPQGSDGPVPKIKLSVWGPKEEKPVYEELAARFAAEKADVVDFSIRFGDMDEPKAADEVLNDVDVAADLFMFADDQLPRLVDKGVLAELPTGYANRVKGRDVDSAVDAASFKNRAGEEALFAFPVTADNGYFLVYNNEFLDEEDVKTLDGILAKTSAAHQFDMDLGNGYYALSFLMHIETITYDFVTELHETTFNTPLAVDALEGVLNVARPHFDKGWTGQDFNESALDDISDERDNRVIAAVTGNWNIAELKGILGDKLGTAKLPTFKPASWKEGDPEIQMGSFAGSKLLGVKSSSANLDWALMFADFITNEESQTLRFETRGGGVTNKNIFEGDLLADEPGLRALALQSPYAIPQGKSVGGKFWDAAGAVGGFLLEEPEATDDNYGKTVQEMLDAFVLALTS